ncbi:MAG: class I SAM-dependent methyltransferase [Acidobacteria bacterium]|nr:class I SAM-dependent methyltransferase [Acidobacteriota bacterium]
MSVLLIAERFASPAANLAGIDLPLDVIAARAPKRLRVIVASETDHRVFTTALPPFDASDKLRLSFAPFSSIEGATFALGVLEGNDDIASDVKAIREAARQRTPIALSCTSEVRELLFDEHAIVATRVARKTEIRTAYWLDLFWCDAHGIYLKGWAHAYEHPLRALRLESGGRVARVTDFSDRPDLLAHYPEHEHVRRGGFTLYLACPPGAPVTLTFETDAGGVTIPLPLPEGPLPAWPEEEEDEDDITPTLRRFATLANERGGRILQIGARTPAGVDPSPPRRLFRSRVTGLDIHPGHCVDLVGDAHGLSRFLRPGSLDAVLSASVLEHLHAPWLLAAEINRALKPGGLVYHQAPGAWPAHAQPNDFWRFSAEGLRVLFGPAAGFEVLEAHDSGAAAIVPTAQWRQRYLDMPTIPAFAMAEVLARKVAEVPEGAIAWPTTSGESRARLYPVDGLQPGRSTR